MAKLSGRQLTLHERLERIEKQNRQLKRSTAFLAIALFALLLMGAAGMKDGHFRQITAQKITITDNAGKELILIGSDTDRSGIRFLNKAGKRVLGMGVSLDQGESGILVADKEGRPRIGLGIDKDIPGMALVDEQGKKVLALGGDATGYGFVVLDENEKRRAGLGYNHGNTGVMLFDDQGQYVRGMVREANGSNYFSYMDDKGKEIFER